MTEIPRDRWGRPLIVPSGGGKATGYTRVSKFAKILDDPFKLCEWQQKAAVLGTVLDRDLHDRVEQVLNDYPHPLDEKDAKQRLQYVIERAKKIAGAERAADRGTDLHSYTDVIDATGDLPDVDEETQKRLIEYVNATTGMGILSIEQFVVNDKYKTAGTFDRLLRMPDGRAVVGDLKTGSWDAIYPMGVIMQEAQYATGNTYDPKTGERGDIHPDLDPNEGILIHLPNKGEGCHLYSLDLEWGRWALDVAMNLRDARKIKASAVCVPL